METCGITLEDFMETKCQLSNYVDRPSQETNYSLNKLNMLFTPLSHQVAGHFYGKTQLAYCKGFLQTNDGFVLKCFQLSKINELLFYKRIFSSDQSKLNEDEIELRKFLPKFLGSEIHNKITYIKMNDIAYGFQNPSIIDIKIGKYFNNPDEPLEKTISRKSKYAANIEKIGFIVSGMRVFNINDDNFDHYDKKFSRSLTDQNLIQSLALYYQFHQSPQIQAIKMTIKKIEEIKKWFEKQTTYHFYRSSLLCVYEAKLETIANACSSNPNGINIENMVNVVMVDFVNTCPAKNTIDENYLFGLNSVLENLNALLAPNFKFEGIR